jgi:predicted aspartyl protease
MHKVFFITLFFLISYTVAPAQNTPVTILPFELRQDNRIYIKCRVNDTDALTFMFDTGANSMVINRDILDKKLKMALDGESDNLGANGAGKVPVSAKNTLGFGNIKIENTKFVAISYGENSFDGVFGSNIMAGYVIEIDYDKKELRFYTPKSYVYKTGEYDRYKIEERSGVFVTASSLNIGKKKYKGYFEIDTGGDGELQLTSPFVAKYQLDKSFKKVATATATGSDGTSVDSPIVVVPEIQLGHKYFYRVPVILSTAKSGIFASTTIDGIYGNNFLKRFNMILDISRKQIFLKPNNLLHTPYYDFLVK